MPINIVSIEKSQAKERSKTMEEVAQREKQREDSWKNFGNGMRGDAAIIDELLSIMSKEGK
jgi:hypothetical protein